MFGGIGSTSHWPTTTSSSSSSSSSSRQDNEKQEKRTSKVATPTSTPTTSQLPKPITLTSVPLMPPPTSAQIAHDPLLAGLYEEHIELRMMKKSLLERLERNSQLLKANQQAESSDTNANRTYQTNTPELNTLASAASSIPSPFLGPQPVLSQTQANRAHQVATTHVFNPLRQQTVPPLTALPAALSAIPSTFSLQSLVQPSLPVQYSSPYYSLNSSTSSTSSMPAIQLQDAYKLCIENAEDLEKRGSIREAEGIYCYLLQTGGVNNVQVLWGCGKFLNKQKKFQDAEMYLKAALQIGYSIEIAIEYIHCLMQQNKQIEAKQQIETVLLKIPSDDPVSQKCRELLLVLNI